MRTRVAVLLPVYIGDTATSLRLAIRSLLRQTEQVKIYLIKDGEVTSSVDEVIKHYSNVVTTIIIEKNVGLAKALNTAIHQIPLKEFEFIARMDADDFSVRRRVEAQINYMVEKCIDVCGSDYIMFNDNNRERIKIKMPDNLLKMRRSILIMSPLCHPSVIFRTSVLSKHKYPEGTYFQEDYRFWIDLIKNGYVFGNVPESLLYFRVSQDTALRRTNLKKILLDIPERYYSLKIYSGNKIIGMTILICRSLIMLVFGRQYLLMLKIRNRLQRFF